MRASQRAWSAFALFPAGRIRDVGAGFDESFFVPLDLAWHLILPVICLSYGGSAFLTKLTRGSLLENLQADYVRTGEWSKKAIEAARKFCDVNVAATAADKNFTYVPKQNAWRLRHRLPSARCDTSC